MSCEKKCVFCNESGASKITLFGDSILKKCIDILKVRVFCKLKYKEVILPTTSDEIHGYHRTCYSYFTAIKKTYADKYNELVNSKQSENTIPEPDASKYANYMTFQYIVHK